MALPQTVRVKLSSEAAESIAITPVVVQELPIRELVEHMLGIAGKDEARIREILLRGTMVSGASRFRWAGWEPDLAGLRELLATFPDPEPDRAFAPERCVRLVLRGGRIPIDVRRATADRKGLFRRASFWGEVMAVVAAGEFRYGGYSYRERADRFVRDLTVVEADRLRAGAEAAPYTSLRDQLRTVAFLSVEVFVER